MLALPEENRPSTDLRLLVAVQGRFSGPPSVAASAALSRFAEHAAGWVAVGAVGAALDPVRRDRWIAAAGAAVAAHGATVVTKRLVRRPRPASPLVAVRSHTPGRYGFPSSHAANTAAFVAVAAGPDRAPVAAAVSAAWGAMAWARLVAGVHYPSDVLVGGVAGALAALVAESALAARQGSQAAS